MEFYEFAAAVDEPGVFAASRLLNSPSAPSGSQIRARVCRPQSAVFSKSANSLAPIGGPRVALCCGAMKDHLLQAPKVAWPSLLVAVLALSSWAVGIVLGPIGLISPAVAFGLVVFGAYAGFTPLHEATHRSIARPHWVSEVVGRLTAVTLIAPFLAVRYVHLEHHKHTNEPDADPDHYSGRGPAWALPVRWLTQDFYFYVFYVRHIRSRPKAEWIEVLATMAAYIVLVGFLVERGYGREALLYWLLPTRIAVGLLAFSFDWLPHYPHEITSKTDRYAATRGREGIVLYLLLFGQSLHLVHHLYPAVPFYRYGKVWRDKVRAVVVQRERREVLQQQGIVTIHQAS
jgi:fatty acid desaturase